ncbi:hypothetical protein [Rhodococcus triatomae]
MTHPRCSIRELATSPAAAAEAAIAAAWSAIATAERNALTRQARTRMPLVTEPPTYFSD